MTETHDVTLSDGRVLEARVTGPADGALLVFHHGSPGAAVPFPTLENAAAERGIRLVQYSRPGFGGSTRHEARTVGDCAADVAVLADHLGTERFLTAGWSGGGPHALACAALLPERVTAAATIAGVAPYDAEGLDWTAGMGEDNQIEYPMAANDPDAHLAWIRQEAEGLATIRAEDIVASLRSIISDVDEASLTGGFGRFVADSFHAAFRDGSWGWRDDDLAFVAPWGFGLSRIHVPVTIWQGRHDLMVPFAHGEWLLGHIPSARSGLRPEHGHLSLLVGSIGEILDDLLETGGLGPALD
jgi:pimeloyl-ACP methyl ester carboxylesterase